MSFAIRNLLLILFDSSLWNWSLYYVRNIKHFPCGYTGMEIGKKTREIVWKHDARRSDCYH